MTRRGALLALRLTLGLLAAAAVGRQLAIHVRLGFDVVNFFSYFTNLSNLLAAAVLLVGAWQLLARRAPSAATDAVRGAAVVQMIVVGVVFAVLLRNADLGQLLPWVNAVLHYVMPLAVALEWLVQPPRTRLGGRQVLAWQVVPLLYLAYVLARGAAVGWYPYPFLNPATAGGYGGVAAYALGIVAVFAAAGWAVVAAGNRPAARDAVAA